MMLFRNWTLTRIVRLLLGAAALTQAYLQADAVYGMLGGLLMVMAFANVGCCSSNGCSVKKTGPYTIQTQTFDEKKAGE